jgi:hypothetical protein
LALPALLLATAACDLRNPAGSLPIAVPAPTDPESRAGAVLVGTFSFPTAAMPAPGQVTSYVRPAPTPIKLEPNSYVLLRIGGTLQAEQNPYILGTKPGQGAISYTAFESAQRTGRGATNLWLHTGGSSWLPPEGGENLTGYFLPDPADGQDLILLVRVGAASADLWAERGRLPGTSLPGWYCFEEYPYCGASETGKFAEPGNAVPNKWIEDYWVKQSHTITATKIAEPLSVDGPAVVAPGDSATFAATPWGELRLRDKAGILPRVWWVWWPGDTTAVPKPYVRPKVLPCDDPSCSFAPTVSGRLRVQTYVEGAPVDAERIVKVQQQRLQLSCPATVVRGSTIECKVEVVSAGTSRWEVTGWKFVSLDGQEEVEPVDPAQQSSQRWAGPMVRSGTVHVTATVSGQPHSASAQVAVSDRSWAGRAPGYTFTQIENGADSRLVLPDEVRWSDDLGSSNWFKSETPASTVPDFTTEVPSGPNEGLDYFSEETTIRVFGYYALNSAAMSRGSAFYSAQEQGGGGGGTRIGGMNWCPASVVTGALPGLVDAHEQLHGSAYERALTRNVAAVLTRLERLTASDNGVLYDAYDAAWNELDTTARAESDAIHGHAGGLINPTNAGRPCALKNERGSILQRKPS